MPVAWVCMALVGLCRVACCEDSVDVTMRVARVYLADLAVCHIACCRDLPVMCLCCRRLSVSLCLSVTLFCMSGGGGGGGGGCLVQSRRYATCC